MRKDEGYAWLLSILGAWLLILLAFLVPGLFYWHYQGARWADCIYGNPVCSLTVGTYTLVALTLATLLAAAYAAAYAKRAFDMEQQVILSINPCRGDQHRRFNENEWYVETSRRKPKLKQGDPGDPSYASVEFDCHSVGRSAFVNGDVWISCHTDAGIRALSLNVGSLVPNRVAHIKLWLPENTKGWRFRWRRRAYHRGMTAVEVDARPSFFRRPSEAEQSVGELQGQAQQTVQEGQELDVPL
jgi:hypothetical protein